MKIMLHNINYVIAVLLMIHSAHGFSVKLMHLSTVYLPHNLDGGRMPQYGFDNDAVEKAVFDPSGKIIYAVGEKLLHIIDATTPKNLVRLTAVSNNNLELTDVALCSGAVFVSYVDNNNLLQGGVLQYQLYDRQTESIGFVRDIKIGSQPDAILPTENCTLVVALENPPVEINSQRQDPPGGVGIIRFPQGITNDPVKKTLDFTAFNNRFSELARSGVRWVFRQNNLFSNDLEPEYLTFIKDQTKAFVCLQENNAIAVVDLVSEQITNMYGLGYKNWSLSKLDPSDEDGGINMASWPVYGMYQPDGIAGFQWEGQDYIITANEGASQKIGDFQEDQRGRSFSVADLSASVSSEMREALQSDSKLGRLHLSNIDGKDQAGKFEKFYTYGARSFSIWRASDMAQVYDSGNELAKKTAELRRELFNNRIKDGDSTVVNGMDKRSDDKGVEPESVAVGKVKGRLLLFVGLERPGSIAVYSLASGGGLQPSFESLYTGGVPSGNSTWGEMYANRSLHAVDPESISFIPADSGLADYPILMVTGVVSGTVSFLKVELSDVTGAAAGSGPVLGTLLSCLILVIFIRL